MYDLIMGVIRAHTYKDSNALLGKIQRMYVEGELSEDQYTALRAALTEAEPVKAYDTEAEIDALWKEVRRIAAIIEAMPEPSPGPEPDPEDIPEWVQPTGAHDAYMKGDKVRYKGVVYESLIDGNVWSPETYPQGWAVVE